jgi:hypothetical protein
VEEGSLYPVLHRMEEEHRIAFECDSCYPRSQNRDLGHPALLVIRRLGNPPKVIKGERIVLQELTR